ncbi:MAG: bifunctional DNA primase/helicase, partial [Dolichospermum sp.]
VSRGAINQKTGKRERIYKIVCIGDQDLRNQIFASWLQRDLMSTENVSAFYQMSAITNNKIINQPDIDITTDTENPPNPPQNCFVFDGLTGTWVGAVLKTSEILINGTYKALVILWNGLERYVWNQSHISIC